MKQILAITRKELNGYFGSPMALIFIGVFLAATLFTFFWLDTFFARGIADVRSLFRWMPLLLIFLVAALDHAPMELRSAIWHPRNSAHSCPFPAGNWSSANFWPCLTLVALALLAHRLTAHHRQYAGQPRLGACHRRLSRRPADGLRLCGNGLVHLLAHAQRDCRPDLTVVVGGILYLIGTRGVTEFVGESVGNILRALATGSRFESIERGVVDARDLVYYLSLTVLFPGAQRLFARHQTMELRQIAPAIYRRNASLGVTLLSHQPGAAQCLALSPFRNSRRPNPATRIFALTGHARSAAKSARAAC